MAHTARSEEEKKEYFDSPEVLDKKVDQLVTWIQSSRHMITFTGAGVSTGAGIPDFRSGMNTVLATGPGAWELKANHALRKSVTTSTLKAIPTPTHMMFVKLHQEGVLKCCVSQNCDGLHRRSGLPKLGLCELHGNSNLEVCTKCKREYLRDYRVRTQHGVHDHLTGRRCDNPTCRGPTKDTIINFGENLPEGELTRAFDHAEKADLCLAMGSSLTVTPAANVPEIVAKRGQKLVIVNLQRTPLHSVADLCIHAKCEEVSKMIMAKLGYDIPEFRLRRRVHIAICPSPDGSGEYAVLLIEGKDIEGLPFSFLKEVHVTVDKGSTTRLVEPCMLDIPWKNKLDTRPHNVRIVLHFHGHYNEPTLTRDITIEQGVGKQYFLELVYNPFTMEWEVTETLDTESDVKLPGV